MILFIIVIHNTIVAAQSSKGKVQVEQCCAEDKKKPMASSPDGWTINHISKQISMHAKNKIRLTVYGHGLLHLG